MIFQEFLAKLEGWKTSPDGEDFCPECWNQYLQRFSRKVRDAVKEDSIKTSKVAESRKVSDGWWVGCASCNKTVSVMTK